MTRFLCINKKMKKYGTRLQVFKGKAEKTKGGLSKNQLRKNARGRIVSRKKSDFAKGVNNPLKKFLIRAGKRRKR